MAKKGAWGSSAGKNNFLVGVVAGNVISFFLSVYTVALFVVLGGVAAGYIAKGNMRRGAVAGLLSTFLVLALALLSGSILGLLMPAVLGIIGGVIGYYLANR